MSAKKPTLRGVSTDTPSLDATLDRLRAWAKANGWQPATMAGHAGLNEKVTRGMFLKDWSPTSTSIRALEALITRGWQAGDPVPKKARAA